MSLGNNPRPGAQAEWFKKKKKIREKKRQITQYTCIETVLGVPLGVLLFCFTENRVSE